MQISFILQVDGCQTCHGWECKDVQEKEVKKKIITQRSWDWLLKARSMLPVERIYFDWYLLRLILNPEAIKVLFSAVQEDAREQIYDKIIYHKIVNILDFKHAMDLFKLFFYNYTDIYLILLYKLNKKIFKFKIIYNIFI